MVIVSQDKEMIVNFDNITEIAQEDGEIGITNDILNDEFQIIAKYETEERAKEVLQEIVSEYKKYATISSVVGDDIRGIYNIPKVYEMPEE